jgi:hypothetical protein
VRIASRAIDQMLSVTPDAVFEPFDQPAEVTVELRGPLERVEEFPIVDRRRLGLARLVAVDVTGHELPEQFADRGSPAACLNTCQVASSTWTRAMWSRRSGLTA